LIWFIAILNSNIVPGQCAEYIASFVCPSNPNTTEYNIQINDMIDMDGIGNQGRITKIKNYNERDIRKIN